MKKRFVLPKKKCFPGGFTVRIQETDMTSEEKADWAYGMDGTGVLSIKKGMTKKQQMYYLSHELVHAMVDYHHFLITEGAEL